MIKQGCEYCIPRYNKKGLSYLTDWMLRNEYGFHSEWSDDNE